MNTEYYRFINISNWNYIKDTLKERITVKPNQRQLILSQEIKEWLNSQISKDVTAFTSKEHQIINAIVFIQEPKSECSIHVDGLHPDRKGAPNWSLNIPLTESDAEMTWYDGPYSLNIKDSQGLPYLDIDWQYQPNLVETIKVDKPVIVNINKPHKVVNLSNHVRMILSIRFNPDL